MNKTINEKNETKPAVKPPRSKCYEEAFTKQAVEPWRQSGKPGTPIARELRVSRPTLKQWKRCYWGDATPVRPDLESEVRALRAEPSRPTRSAPRPAPKWG